MFRLKMWTPRCIDFLSFSLCGWDTRPDVLTRHNSFNQSSSPSLINNILFSIPSISYYHCSVLSSDRQFLRDIVESSLSTKRRPLIGACSIEEVSDGAFYCCFVDAMEIPQTREDAQEHIAKIRTEKGLDGPNCNSSDLEAALVM